MNVGIMSEQTIRFVLNGNYLFNGKQYTGEYTATAEQGQIRFDGQLYDELHFQGGENFVLRGVTIGVNFHWQRREDQTFKGNLKIIAGHDRVLNKEAGLIAINEGLYDFEIEMLEVGRKVDLNASVIITKLREVSR